MLPITHNKINYFPQKGVGRVKAKIPAIYLFCLTPSFSKMIFIKWGPQTENWSSLFLPTPTHDVLASSLSKVKETNNAKLTMLIVINIVSLVYSFNQQVICVA